MKLDFTKIEIIQVKGKRVVEKDSWKNDKVESLKIGKSETKLKRMKLGKSV